MLPNLGLGKFLSKSIQITSTSINSSSFKWPWQNSEKNYWGKLVSGFKSGFKNWCNINILLCTNNGLRKNRPLCRSGVENWISPNFMHEFDTLSYMQFPKRKIKLSWNALDTCITILLIVI